MKLLTKLLLAFLILNCALLIGEAEAQPELYGLMLAGGAENFGAIVSIKADGSNFNTRHSFETPYPGENPQYGHLIQATANGKLYGMTYQGGTYGYGVLFEYDPTTNTSTPLPEIASSPLRSCQQGLDSCSPSTI